MIDYDFTSYILCVCAIYLIEEVQANKKNYQYMADDLKENKLTTVDSADIPTDSDQRFRQHLPAPPPLRNHTHELTAGQGAL